MTSSEQKQAPVGVLVMAYGTPTGPEQLESYYTHIRHGRPPTPELLIKQISDSIERVQEKKIISSIKAVTASVDQRVAGNRGALAAP